MNLRMRLIGAGLAVSAMYVVAARLGFELAFVAEQVTTVWAPTGIAQAALLLWGVRLWPGVWAGAFLANAFSNAPLWTAGAIATGNTLEAVALVWLLGRTRFDPSLSHVTDAARFVLFGAVLVTSISATIGVATLCAASVQPWHRFADLWSAWWVGDALGSLVIAPVILTAARPVHERTARNWVSVIVTMAASAALAAIVFGGGAGSMAGNAPLQYVLFPFVIAAAVLVGQPATALAVFVASAVAITNTVAGRGPFSALDAGSGLILLQIFTGVLASTALLLCAAITERQIMQSRMRAVLDTALDAVIAMDHQGIISEFNPAAERMFGHARNDAVGKELSQLIIPEDLRAQHRKGLRHYLLTGEGPFLNRRVETRGLHASGREFPIEVAITTLKDEAPARFTGFVRDLTERKRDEERLRASQEQLREADRRKDEFLAMLAHELRNPLAPIRTGLEVWRLAGKDEAAAGQVRLMMERQVAHMVRLIDDLLEVSRITSGKIHLHKERADLHEMVDAAVDANRAALDAAGLRLELQLPTGAVEVWVDPTRVVQVISNLLHNTAKFTGAGGVVTVKAGVRRRADGGDDLGLSVSDTGAGISAELLPHVFDLFTQGQRATKADSTGLHPTAQSPRGGDPGLGVGLALARRIVDLHDGTIEARSAGLGHGSEFIVRIPIVAGDDLSESQHDMAPADAQQSFDRRVLIVDDNADGAEITAMLIRGMGGEAITAVDGATGIQQALALQPDIILLDIGLPDMDGYEVCRTIRQRAEGVRPWIVAITGWGQQRDKDRSAAAGFDAHLTKPVDPAVLERILRSRFDSSVI